MDMHTSPISGFYVSCELVTGYRGNSVIVSRKIGLLFQLSPIAPVSSVMLTNPGRQS